MEESKKNKPREVRWTAPEYVFHPKTTDWFWWFGLIIVLLVGVAFYLNNILFVFVILIGAFSLLVYAIRPPKIVEYTLTERGIFVGNKLYRYQEINTFHIDDRINNREDLLLLQLEKMTEPLLTLPLEGADLDEVRDFLLDFTEEKEIARPIGQILMDKLGF